MEQVNRVFGEIKEAIFSKQKTFFEELFEVDKEKKEKVYIRKVVVFPEKVIFSVDVKKRRKVFRVDGEIRVEQDKLVYVDNNFWGEKIFKKDEVVFWLDWLNKVVYKNQ